MTIFQKKQLREFVNIVNGKKVSVRFVKDKHLTAWTFKNINRICFNPDVNFLKLYALVFHEVGHLNIKTASLSIEEYEAQMWTIRRAEKLGYTKISLQLIRDFSTWSTLDWNSDQRRYVMAAKIYFRKISNNVLRVA